MSLITRLWAELPYYVMIIKSGRVVAREDMFACIADRFSWCFGNHDDRPGQQYYADIYINNENDKHYVNALLATATMKVKK